MVVTLYQYYYKIEMEIKLIHIYLENLLIAIHSRRLQNK